MKAENRLSSTTTLTVNVMDSDDQDPAFEHDTYNAKVSRGIKFKMSDNNTKVTKNCLQQCKIMAHLLIIFYQSIKCNNIIADESNVFKKLF